MTLDELLSEVRGIYTTHFAAVLAQYPKAMSEAALRTASGVIATDGVLKLPTRLDIIPRSEDGFAPSVMVDSPRRLNFAPVEIHWSSSLSVRLSPFVWDNCSLVLPGIKEIRDWKPLVTWFEHWFDLGDNNKPDKAGLFGYAHFLSDPERTAAGLTLATDLGTAPAQAFELMLDAVSAMGITEAHVS